MKLKVAIIITIGGLSISLVLLVIVFWLTLGGGPYCWSGLISTICLLVFFIVLYTKQRGKMDENLNKVFEVKPELGDKNRDREKTK